MRSTMNETQQHEITTALNALVLQYNQKADAVEGCKDEGTAKNIKALYYARVAQRIMGFEDGLGCMGVWVDIKYTEPTNGIQWITGWEFI